MRLIVAMLATAALAAAPALAGDKKKHAAGQPCPSCVQMQQSKVLGMQETMISTYPAYERRMPASFYDVRFHFTPREYRRLRSQGFSPDEVYLIANASKATGLDTRVFADAIYRGEYARTIAYDHGINPNELTAVDAEWRTPAWADATGDPVYTHEKVRVWY